MTISSPLSRIAYEGDGTTGTFAVPFVFLENAHVSVLLRDSEGAVSAWTEGTHYTLTGAGQAEGGTLTVVASPTDHRPQDGEILFALRAVPETQETDYPEGGAFPARAHEQALDKLTMIAQQHSERLGRCIVTPATDLGQVVELPNEQARASRFLAFDGTGAPIAAAGTSADLGPVSAFMAGLLASADASAARGGLAAMADVVSARGDLVRGGGGGAERLALGTGGHVLASDGSDAVWSEVPAATEERRGGLEIATAAETAAGSAADRIVPPDRMHRHPAVATAWADIVGATLPALNVHHLAQSVSRTGAGAYTVTWAVTFASAEYGVLIKSRHKNGIRRSYLTAQSAGSLAIQFLRSDNVAEDVDAFTVVAFGPLA